MARGSLPFGGGRSRRLVAASAFLALASTARAPAFVDGAPVTGSVRGAAIACGYDAASLAAAGVDASGAQALLQRVADAAEALSDEENAAAAYDAATQALSAATASSADGDASAAAGVAGLEAGVAAARAALDARLAALCDVAEAGLGAETRGRLANLRGSRERAAPAELRVVARPADSWRLLETALRAEARSQRLATALDPELAAALAEARADPSVGAAAASLAANLASVETVLASE